MFRPFAFVLVLAAAALAQSAADPSDPVSTDTPPAAADVTRTSGERRLPELVPATPSRASLAPGTLTNEQIKQLIARVAENDIENDKRQRNYTYTEREESHQLDSKGNIKSTEIKTSEVMMIYGEQVERLVAKNDKPLSDKDQRKEEEKIQKVIDKRKNETEEQRKKRLEKEEKDREHDREFVRDVSDAYNFRLLGTEFLDGRNTYVIDAEPRPGFQPQHRDTRLLSKFRFRIWIDAAEPEWVKLDAQCLDTVSWGLFLARIHKGSRIVIENTRVNDEVWLPKHVDVRVDARLGLIIGLNANIDVTYRDYQKFHTDTKIVDMGEVQDK